MKLIIAGSRDLFLSKRMLDDIINMYNIYPTEVVSGMSKGIDECGEMWSRCQVDDRPNVVQFPADWETHGKAAGPIRNRQMAEYSNALLLIWDGESKGSANMKKEMLKLNKPVYEVILRKHDGQ